MLECACVSVRYRKSEDVSANHMNSWKTYRKTYVLLGNSWQTLKPKKNLNKFNFFNEMNVCQEFPIKTYVFRLMK